MAAAFDQMQKASDCPAVRK